MLSPAEHIQGFNKHPKYNGKINQIQICQTRRPLEERIVVKSLSPICMTKKRVHSNLSICGNLRVFVTTTVKSHSLLKQVKDSAFIMKSGVRQDTTKNNSKKCG